MNEQDQRIQKGLQLAASLPDITPEQASSQLKGIYDDIQQRLRVPMVNLIFRTLANYPDYLEHLWKHFSSVLLSNSFEQEADGLREKALLEQVLDMAEDQRLQLPQDAETLRAFNDTIFYVLPKLLLITTAFYEASFRTVPERRGRGAAPTAGPDLEPGIASGTTKAPLVDPEKASESVKALLRAIQEKHGHPMVSTYYRGLANWPGVLEQAWTTLGPLVGSSEYENLKGFLVDQAHNALRRLPFTQPATIPMPEAEAEDIQAILAAFRYKFIPEMLIDAALIKALLDGPEEAFSSRFSASTTPEEPEE